MKYLISTECKEILSRELKKIILTALENIK